MSEQRKSLKSGFTDLMISRILSGELKAGDKLPPERELAESVGLSRGSVNQGILDLERMGFLRIVPRHGTYVAEYLSGANPETLSAIMSYDSALIDQQLFNDLMALRTLIEGESVFLAAGRMKGDELAELRTLTDRIFSGSEDKLADNLFDYHMYIVRMSGNRAYAMLFCSFEKMIRKLIEAHYGRAPEELKKTLPIYIELTEAICQGKRDESRKLLETVLDYGADYLNKVLRQYRIIREDQMLREKGF